jgi:hypothetical protein
MCLLFMNIIIDLACKIKSSMQKSSQSAQGHSNYLDSSRLSCPTGKKILEWRCISSVFPLHIWLSFVVAYRYCYRSIFPFSLTCMMPWALTVYYILLFIFGQTRNIVSGILNTFISKSFQNFTFCFAFIIRLVLRLVIGHKIRDSIIFMVCSN